MPMTEDIQRIVLAGGNAMQIAEAAHPHRGSATCAARPC
jgi:hypothetical protein